MFRTNCTVPCHCPARRDQKAVAQMHPRYLKAKIVLPRGLPQMVTRSDGMATFFRHDSIGKTCSTPAKTFDRLGLASHLRRVVAVIKSDLDNGQPAVAYSVGVEEHTGLTVNEPLLFATLRSLTLHVSQNGGASGPSFVRIYAHMFGNAVHFEVFVGGVGAQPNQRSHPCCDDKTIPPFAGSTSAGLDRASRLAKKLGGEIVVLNHSTDRHAVQLSVPETASVETTATPPNTKHVPA